MNRLIVAFCGSSRSGKSTLARRLVEKTGGSFVSFGDFVRSEFEKAFPDQVPSRRDLQDLGQRLISIDPKGFLERAIATQANPLGQVIVLDGLRHIALVGIIHEQYPDSEVSVVFVEADSHERGVRSFPISVEELLQIDSHQMEEDGPKLRAIAELVIGTDLGQIQSLEVLDSWAASKGIVVVKSSE